MKIGNFALWVTNEEAAAFGCTHHGRFMGLIPGFLEPEQMLWISRSDLFAPFEDLLSVIWVTMRQMRGEEPDFMFEVGPEIAPLESN